MHIRTELPLRFPGGNFRQALEYTHLDLNGKISLMSRLEVKEFLRIQMLQKLCDLYQKRSFKKKTTIPWKTPTTRIWVKKVTCKQRQ